MMPTDSFLPRFFRILILLLLVTTFSPAVRAEADVIDDFAGLLDKVEFAGYKPGWLPISGNDVRQSRELVTCIDGAHSDVEALTCVEDYKNTPVGQKITQQSQIPSWFWDLMETYIAYRTEDYWGVVAKLGEAAICIIAQVMTGGAVDVCGVIEELVKIGKELLDAAKAVAQFFVSLGEGAWEAAKDVGCAIGLGGCDDDSSPPEVVAYNWVFAPKIGAGLAAIEAVSANDYPLLRAQLEQNANADPAVLSDPNLDEIVRKMMGGITFPQHAVTTASKIYDEAVNAQWKADVAKNVLPELAKQRDAYDSPQQVAVLAPAALAAYESKLPVQQQVSDRCRADLNQTYGFAHVDRWIQKFPADAKGLGDVRPNAEWCRVNFWENSRDEFAEHFRAYVEQKLCPAFGQTLMCTSVENYQSCLNLMGTVGHEGACGVNVAAAGKQAAERIVSELKAKGSTHSYQIVADNSIMSSKPVDLLTVRPTQQHFCNEIYQTLYGKLPQKIVNCKLQLTPSYILLMKVVAGESDRLADKYQLPFGIDAIDPLIVVAPSTEIMNTIQNDPGQTFKFEFFPLKVPHFVDGVNKPSMGFNLPLPAPNELAAVNLKQELINFKAGGPDQWRQPTMDATTSPVERLSANQMQTERLGANQMQAARIGAGALPGMDAGQLGAGQMGAEPMQAMSGSLPPGSAPGVGSALGAAGKLTATAPRVTALPQAAMVQGLADLAADARVTIAGKSATWGQNLTLDAASAQGASNGLCTFLINYVVRNLGTATSGPFQSAWSNSAVPAPVNREWPAIPPNGSTAQTDALGLKSGPNLLTLTLDQRRQVNESDENNNQLRLTVTVTGQCGAAAQPGQPTLPIRPTLPAPGTVRPQPESRAISR